MLANLEYINAATFIDGIIYEGQIFQDKRHGWGRGLMLRGSFYEGYWRDGIPFGFGRLISPDGSYYEGMSINGKA